MPSQIEMQAMAAQVSQAQSEKLMAEALVKIGETLVRIADLLEDE